MAELKRRPLFNPEGDTEVVDRRMIGGNTTNLNDFNNMKYPWVSDWYRQAMNNFWVPEEINLSKDIKDYPLLDKAERRAYDKILSFLIFLLGSIKVFLVLILTLLIRLIIGFVLFSVRFLRLGFFCLNLGGSDINDDFLTFLQSVLHLGEQTVGGAGFHDAGFQHGTVFYPHLRALPGRIFDAFTGVEHRL